MSNAELKETNGKSAYISVHSFLQPLNVHQITGGQDGRFEKIGDKKATNIDDAVQLTPIIRTETKKKGKKLV